MAEHQEGSIKSLSISSWDNRFSFGSSSAEAFQGDEEFYEEIEAPKFVDFTAADHFCPDDRYWFCGRVGCDQKHEEEMDSEAIYKKFVRRAMAARSPNVIRIRKILDRDASRKCPLSAPPKLPKPKMALVSSFPKRVNEKVKVLKPQSTPVAKGKPVSSKYLTTPRIRKSKQEENSFRSVQNPKPKSTQVSKSRMVAKALVFHSPNKKKDVSKLCEGVKKLEVSSQHKGYSGKSSVIRRPEEKLCSKTQESRLGMSVRSKIKGGKLSQQHQSLKNEPSHEEAKATHDLDSGLSDDSDYFDLCLKTSSNKESKLVKSKSEESHEIKEQSSAQKEFGLQESTQDEEALRDSDLALSCDSKGEESDDLRSQATNMQENNSSGRKETVDQMTENNPSGQERDEQHGYVEDDDDKENAAASDENRMHEKNPKKNGRKILAVQSGKKVVATQAQDKKLKEGQLSSTSVVKPKKPKATNPKPFRLRTDERGILKERRTEHVVPTPSGKLQTKQGNDVQGIKTPEHKKHQDRKPTNPPHESKAMQRLERFRKISSLQKHSAKPQEIISTKKETTSFLIPGQKLDVILENSPEVLALKRAGKIDDPSGDDAATSQPLTRVRREAAKPILCSANVPRKTSCSSKPE